MRQKKPLLFMMLFASVSFLLAFGCSKEETKTAVPQPATPASVPQPAAPASVPQPTAQPLAQAPQPTAAAPSTSSAAPVLATADGEQQGVRAEVTELKRTSGGTINLKFIIVNDSDRDFNSRSLLTGEEYASVDGITLIDPVGKKKYFVVRDTEKHCVCSRNVIDMRKNSRSNLWAKFPAPPEDVQKISVTIPHFQPMDDVPISR